MHICRCLCGTVSFSTNAKKDSHDRDDYVYNQNKIWILIVLQLAYVTFLLGCLPYAFICFPASSRWFPMCVFLAITAVCSITSCCFYVLVRSHNLIYLSLILYGAIFPYVCWFCAGQYMATSAACWHWLTLSMVLASLLSSWRRSLWLLLLQALTPIAGGLADAYGGSGLEIHALILRALSLIVPDLTIFLLLAFFAQVLKHSRNQALLRQELGQAILRNILPMPVADRLMEELAVGTRCHIAHDFPLATVAFCDIVGFTQLCLSVSPSALVDMLNDIFTCFDRLCLMHGVEKIKTIGDAYMFAGFPASNESPTEAAVAVVHVAVRMIRHVTSCEFAGRRVEIRSGAHSGPVVAGVIGCTKFQYDVWGPTVNLASRMESSGVPNEVQVSTATRDLIADYVPCTYRGNIPLKGAGNHDAFFVDLSAIPAIQQEDPEVLRGMGLDDMAFLVQEINRRQAEYKFVHGASVAPLAAPTSPTNASQPLLSTSNRRITLSSPLGRGLSIVPSPSGGASQEPPIELRRTDRIMRLIHAMDGSPGNLSPSDTLLAIPARDTLRPLAGTRVVTGQQEQTLTGTTEDLLELPGSSPRQRQGRTGNTGDPEGPFLSNFPSLPNILSRPAHSDETKSDRSRQSQSVCSHAVADTEGAEEDSPQSSAAGDGDLGTADSLQELCSEGHVLPRPYRGLRSGSRRQSMSSTGSPPRVTRRFSVSPLANLSLTRRQSISIAATAAHSPGRAASFLRRHSMHGSSPNFPARLNVPVHIGSPNRRRGSSFSIGGSDHLSDHTTGSPVREITVSSLLKPNESQGSGTSGAPSEVRESRVFDPRALAELSSTSLPATSPLWTLARPTSVAPHPGPLLPPAPQIQLSSSTSPPRISPQSAPRPPPPPPPSVPRLNLSPSPSTTSRSSTPSQRALLGVPTPPDRANDSPLRQWRRRWALEAAAAAGAAPEDWKERLLPPFMRNPAAAPSQSQSHSQSPRRSVEG